MKIGFIIYGTLKTLSGGYLYDRQLVAHLRAMGCTVDILSLPWRNYAQHLRQNFAFAWAHKIAQTRYDLLLQDELNHPSLFLLNSYLRAACACPIITIVHHLRISEEHPPRLMALYRLVERHYLNSVDGYIFNSKTTRNIVQHFTGHTRPNIVAYPAADHRNPPPHDKVMQALSTRQQKSQPLQLLFIGNLIPRKGLYTLLNALARVQTHNPQSPQWHLHIVGSEEIDPPHSAQMRYRANTLSLAQQITWHGRLSDDALNQLLATSDLLVMPSYEGFGIVYLEAMAYGLPVIAANFGAAPELIQHNINGYLIPPPNIHSGNADEAEYALAHYLEQLQSNRVHLMTMAYFARQRYESHPNWQESMQSTHEWLHEVTSPTNTTEEAAKR